MKNLLLLSILLLLFSCKKEEHRFPRTTEELKAVIEETRLKKVESCDSEIAKMLCLGDWRVDTLKPTYLSNSIIFECNGTYSYKTEDRFWSDETYSNLWHLDSDTLTIYNTYFLNLELTSRFNKDSILFNKFIIKKGEHALIINSIENFKYNYLSYPTCNCPLDIPLLQPSLQWMLDSFHNSIDKEVE